MVYGPSFLYFEVSTVVAASRLRSSEYCEATAVGAAVVGLAAAGAVVGAVVGAAAAAVVGLAAAAGAAVGAAGLGTVVGAVVGAAAGALEHALAIKTPTVSRLYRRFMSFAPQPPPRAESPPSRYLVASGACHP